LKTLKKLILQETEIEIKTETEKNRKKQQRNRQNIAHNRTGQHRKRGVWTVQAPTWSAHWICLLFGPTNLSYGSDVLVLQPHISTMGFPHLFISSDLHLCLPQPLFASASQIPSAPTSTVVAAPASAYEQHTTPSPQTSTAAKLLGFGNEGWGSAGRRHACVT
jgi:hypothetical protein